MLDAQAKPTANTLKKVKSQKSQNPQKDILHDFLQKLFKQFEKEENKQWIQLYFLDPILTYILERMFPYILILTVLFFLLTVMVTITLIVIFMRVPRYI